MVKNKPVLSLRRSKALYLLVIFIWAIFIGRLFYVQVINSGYYRNLASETQERKFEIEAQRGLIYFMDRDVAKPAVLNENLPTVFADPRYIDEPLVVAKQVADIIGGQPNDYLEMLNKESAYVELRKRVSLELANEIDLAEIKGVATLDEFYRVYPEDELAAQVLGFVNADGEGQYGIEEYLDQNLAGVNGRVEAITDVNGVPLRGEDGNVISDAVDGNSVVLTIDANIQQAVETALEGAVKAGQARGGAVVVLDPNNGGVKAMANYPTFHPAQYNQQEDFSVFINSAVSNAYEAGSVIKPFTMAAGLDIGVINRNSTYYDAGYVQVDDRRINNADVIPSGFTRSMDDVIRLSINTGVIHILKQLGGGDINNNARNVLYKYFTDRFGFGNSTGIEQAYEARGVVFGPQEGSGVNVRYANMAFGQGMTVTMLQAASAMSALINGGTYYKPTMIVSENYNDAENVQVQPLVLRANVIGKKTSRVIKEMLKLVVEDGAGRSAKKGGYNIGGKSGSAQIALPDGTYSHEQYIGSFIGYIEGGKGLEYVIMTRIDEPQGYRFAGSGAAAPLFAEISNWIIDYDKIPPVN